MQQASVELDGLYEGLDYNSSISRARFEDLVRDLVQTCVSTAAKCLEVHLFILTIPFITLF